MDEILTNPEGVSGEAEELETEQAEAETEESNEEESQAEELEEIIWNGEPKKLSKQELKELAQKGFDYTQKTQQISEAWKALERDYQAFQTQRQLNEQLVDHVSRLRSIDAQIEQLNQLDWQSLAQDDPAKYTELDAKYKLLHREKAAAVNEYRQAEEQMRSVQAEAYQRRLAAEKEKLIKAVPEWADQSKFDAARVEMIDTLEQYGYSKDELNGVTDHRLLLILRDAMAYRKIKAQKPAARPVTNAPAPAKTINTTKASAPNPEKMSIDEWMAWRNNQIRNRKR